MIHRAAGKISVWCGKHMEIDEAEEKVIAYGLGMLLDTLLKYLLLLLAGVLLHRQLEILITLISIGVFRCFAGGYHSRTSSGCFLYMLAVCSVSVTAAVCSAGLPLFLCYSGYLIVLLLVWRCAPLASAKNPFTDAAAVRRKKRGAMLVVLCSMLAAALLHNSISFSFFYPLMIEAIVICGCTIIRTLKRTKSA